jgi:hypothetical protein
MKLHRFPIPILCAACGAAATAPPVVANDPPPPVSVREVTACPTGAELDAVAGRAFARDGELGVICTSLWAGEPLWLLDGYVDVPYDDAGEHGGITLATAVVTPAGEVTWSLIDDGYPPAVLDKKAGGEWTAIDLDGDGDDELLVIDGWMSHGYESLSLRVYDVVGRALVASTELPMVDDNSGAVETEQEWEICRAEHRLVDDGAGGTLIEVIADPRPTKSGEGCPAPGTHRYRWDGKALVEVP